MIRCWLHLEPDLLDDDRFEDALAAALWMEERFLAKITTAVNRGFVGEE